MSSIFDNAKSIVINSKNVKKIEANGGTIWSATTILLDLLRPQGTNFNSASNYINPARYDYAIIPSETACGIANLSHNSITVTENGKGGRGIMFPLTLSDGTYTLTWSTGNNSHTRFRLQYGLQATETGSVPYSTFDSNGSKTSATIVVSNGGKTAAVNSDAAKTRNDGNPIVLRFFFGASTGNTVAYSNVILAKA